MFIKRTQTLQTFHHSNLSPLAIFTDFMQLYYEGTKTCSLIVLHQNILYPLSDFQMTVLIAHHRHALYSFWYLSAYSHCHMLSSVADNCGKFKMLPATASWQQRNLVELNTLLYGMPGQNTAFPKLLSSHGSNFKYALAFLNSTCTSNLCSNLHITLPDFTEVLAV